MPFTVHCAGGWYNVAAFKISLTSDITLLSFFSCCPCLQSAPFLITSKVHHFPEVPLFHFLFHVNALLLQQLPLGEGPVHRLRRGLSTWGPLPLSPGLNRVVEPEHMALPQDDAIS